MNRIETKVLTAIIAVIGSVTTLLVNDISKNLKELNQSVSTVLERTSGHEKRIEKLETNCVLKN